MPPRSAVSPWMPACAGMSASVVYWSWMDATDISGYMPSPPLRLYGKPRQAVMSSVRRSLARKASLWRVLDGHRPSLLGDRPLVATCVTRRAGFDGAEPSHRKLDEPLAAGMVGVML